MLLTIRFTVYTNHRDQQQALLKHIVDMEQSSLRCAIVAPRVSHDGLHRVSASAQCYRPPHLEPILHSLLDLDSSRRKTLTRSGSDSDSDSDSGSDSGSSSGSDSDSDEDKDNSGSDDDHGGQRNGDDHNRGGGNDDGKKAEVGGDTGPFPYEVYLEYHTPRAFSSRLWGTALFYGFDEQQQLRTTTPQCVSSVKDERDNYIANLVIQHHTAAFEQTRPALYGTPTLDEVATLRLVSCLYHTREDKQTVIDKIREHCVGRGAAQSTIDRITKNWRLAHQISATPRKDRAPDVVADPPQLEHPFYANKQMDERAAEFVHTDKPLNRLVYRPLVVWSKKGRIGKTGWAKSLGRHIHIRGSLDAETIHAGIQQGADVLILDNVKWHRLFDSDLGRALAEGQDSVTWVRRNGQRATTKLTVPVIILNNKKCKSWGPNSEKYWKKNLNWVRVRECLFDESKTKIDTNAVPPTATAPLVPAAHDASAVDEQGVSSRAPVATIPVPSVDESSFVTPPTVGRLWLARPGWATAIEHPAAGGSQLLARSPSSDSERDAAEPSSDPSSPTFTQAPPPSLAADVEMVLEQSSAAPPPTSWSLASIPAALLPIVPKKLNIKALFPKAKAFGENKGSYYIPNFLSKAEADDMLASIGAELQPLYVARDDPTVQVLMYKLRRGVSRDKAALSDAAASLRPLYRYGAPELAQAEPFSKAPTVLRIRDLIFERIGVRSNHMIGNRYDAQVGTKGEKRDGIGSHQDKDRDFPVGGPIMTLTLCEPGGERTLEMIKWEHTGKTVTRYSKKLQKEVVKPVKSKLRTKSIVMEHGSLTIIDWHTNHMWGKTENGRVWKHEVKQVKGACGMRFGLTYRCIGTIWDVSTGEILNVKGKREQAVPLMIVDNHGAVVPRDQATQPRWSMSSKPTTEDLVDVAGADEGEEDDGDLGADAEGGEEDDDEEEEEEEEEVRPRAPGKKAAKRKNSRKSQGSTKKKQKRSVA